MIPPARQMFLQDSFDEGDFPVKTVKGKSTRFVAEPAAPLPASVDLRVHCSPIEDQLGLGSCTAQAGAGVIEYYERRAFGRHIDASRLFLYKVTRNPMKMKDNTGAFNV